MRQHPFGGNAVNGWNQFQVATDSRQVQCEQIVVILHSRPTADLFESDDTIGLHIEMVNGKSGVLINQRAQQPVPAFPKHQQRSENRQQDRQTKSERPQTHAPPLAGTQLYVQHMITLKSAITRFASSKGQIANLTVLGS